VIRRKKVRDLGGDIYMKSFALANTRLSHHEDEAVAFRVKASSFYSYACGLPVRTHI
jgi:hypothetical protein